AFLPGGASWKAVNGRVWNYRDKEATVAGITKAGLKSRSPGEIKYVIVGKGGTYLPPSGTPVEASLVIDAPVAATGQCGEANFVDGTEESCRLLAGGDKMLCK